MKLSTLSLLSGPAVTSGPTLEEWVFDILLKSVNFLILLVLLILEWLGPELSFLEAAPESSVIESVIISELSTTRARRFCCFLRRCEVGCLPCPTHDLRPASVPVVVWAVCTTAGMSKFATPASLFLSLLMKLLVRILLIETRRPARPEWLNKKSCYSVLVTYSPQYRLPECI